MNDLSTTSLMQRDGICWHRPQYNTIVWSCDLNTNWHDSPSPLSQSELIEILFQWTIRHFNYSVHVSVKSIIHIRNGKNRKISISFLAQVRKWKICCFFCFLFFHFKMFQHRYISLNDGWTRLMGEWCLTAGSSYESVEFICFSFSQIFFWSEYNFPLFHHDEWEMSGCMLGKK